MGFSSSHFSFSEIVEKVYEDKADDEILEGDNETNNWYELITPDGRRRIKHRVTDRVKHFYKKHFTNKEFSKSQKIENEFKRQMGIKYHGYLENIASRFFHTQPNDIKYGEKRDSVIERPIIDNETDATVYLKLEKYFIDLMKEHFKDDKSPMVFSEVIIYDDSKDEVGESL